MLRHKSFSLILLIFSLFTFALSAETVRYTILLSGNNAGFLTTERLGNNQFQIHYEFNDRGRGPKIDQHLVVDNNSIPQSMDIQGVDYLKNPVQERFSITNGKAIWKNPAESGEKQLSGNAFYSSMNGASTEYALLTRALLAAPGQKLLMLPAGETQVRKVGELNLTCGAAPVHVIHYEVSGLGLLPTPIWLDADQTYFATADSWFSTIRTGWESCLPELLRTQDAATKERQQQNVKELAHKPGGPVAIKNAKVFHSEEARVLNDQTIVIYGNRIESIGPSTKIKVPGNAQIIDAAGKMVLPGLADMHVHLSDTDGMLDIAAGVTTVRDMANDIDKLRTWKQQFDQGEAIGPHVFMAGFMDSPGPYAGPSKVLVSTEEEARSWVRKYKSMGYIQIKIYSSMKPELVPAIIEEAHKLGLRVSGHIPAFMTAEQAVRLGFDEIQHINFLFLNFLPDVKDTRTPVRFIAVAEHAAELDLNSPKVQTFIALLKERHTALDPTVNVFESLFTDRPGKIPDAMTDVADRLPPLVRRGLLQGGLPVPEGKDELYHKSFLATLKMLKMLYDSGITIEAGTDSFAGFDLHRELELYVQAGIPAEKVLQIATFGAARILKQDAVSGSISPGKAADLVIVKGDPVKDIQDIRNVETIIKDGVIYNSHEVYQRLGIR